MAPAYAPVRLPADISGSDLEATDHAWAYLGYFYENDLPRLRPALTDYAHQLLGADEPLRPFTQDELSARLDAAGLGSRQAQPPRWIVH